MAANFKTGSLQQTENYIWNTADTLGRGATAVVYFGRHKVSGDVCAVKVFHERTGRHMFSVRQREIETLQSLQHDNIVKLLALESEVVTGMEVLVMEYCSGGSLYTILEQPEYAYGFPEDEFLRFLKHIADGMRYLRSQGYIHRDIKPGNIMKYTTDDGRSLYKLTDFGAARELQDDETFMSIYGTEEYLYPKMYETAVLRRPGVHQFDASVDLWSLGVTLFHVAVGHLPFQPYGGRRNAATMHLITSKKPPSAISGIQATANGQIEWRYTLPDTCQLSEYLKRELVEMIAGLLETDQARMWTFDQFFNRAHKLDHKLVLSVFSCCTAHHMKVFVEPLDTYSDLQERLAAETDLPASQQLILWHDKLLTELIEPTAAIRSFPDYIKKTRLNLINTSIAENFTLNAITLPSFPEIDLGADNLEDDARSAKKAAAIAHLTCTEMKKYIAQQKYLAKGELMFRQHVKGIVFQFKLLLPDTRQRLSEIRLHQESFGKTFNLLMKLFTTLNSVSHVEEKMTSKVGQDVQFTETLTQLLDCVHDDVLNELSEKIFTRLNEIEVYVGVLDKRITEQEVDRWRHPCGCTENDHCVFKADMFRSKIMNVSTTMMKHRKYGELHSHEQFIHKCEKQKLQEYNMFLSSLASEHCKKNLQTCFKNAQKEMGYLTKHLTRTRKVEQNITSVKDNLSQLSARLKQKEEKCRAIVERITKLLEQTFLHRKRPHSKSAPLVFSESREQPSGAEAPMQVGSEEIRSELPMQESISSESDSSGRETNSTKPSRKRTVLLGQLTNELLSLKTDSNELRQLVFESGNVMKQFLSETSSLHIEGSLDSDQRRYPPDDT